MDDEFEVEFYDESVEVKECIVEEWKGGFVEGWREVEFGFEGCIFLEVLCCLFFVGRKCFSFFLERFGRGIIFKLF